MSLKDRFVRVLESVLERLSGVEDAGLDTAERLDSIERKLDQVIAGYVQTHDEATTLRARLIEESSRRGEELHRHQVALMDHEGRLHRLERKGDGKAGSNGTA